LRWIFVREQSTSPSTFWIDVTRSFEKAIGRKFASVKRKIISLEEQWRAKFAVRDAQPGLQGNNNTELARAMRAWIAFRDEEERAKKEKEEDEKALAVRRERLHELESERLGLTDLCRYETTVVGEEEETGRQGVDTGDRSNPISLEGAVDEEPQQPRPVNNLYRDLEPTNISNDKTKNADPVAPIVELLRKRQREEREEADIRREEQVLLNKRLAMMEEQVQMLSKLMQKSQPASQPTPPPRPVVIDLDGDANESTEVPARRQVDAGDRPQLVPQPRLAAIDLNGDANESIGVPARPQADARALAANNSTEALAEVAETSPNVPMTDVSMPDAPANTTAGSDDAAADACTSGSNDTTGPVIEAADTRKSNDPPEQSPDVSMDGSAEGPSEAPTRSETAAVGTNESVDTPNANVEYSPNVSMDGTADGLDETPAESGTEVSDDTAETQIEVDVDDSPGTASMPISAETEDTPEDASRT
jgi:hypothetical protein